MFVPKGVFLYHHGVSFFFFKFNFYLFIYLWLCWVLVSVRGLSLVVASGGHASSRCAGLSLPRPLVLRSTGSRRAGSVVVAHGPSCSAACGIFPDQGSNPYPLHWQADSQPLRHQGSPMVFLICSLMLCPLGYQDTCRASADPHGCPLPLLGASVSHRMLGPATSPNPSTPHPPPRQTNAPRPHCRAVEAACLLPVGLLPLPKAKGIATSAEGRTTYLEGGRARASSCLSSRTRPGAAGPRRATPQAGAVRMRFWPGP